MPRNVGPDPLRGTVDLLILRTLTLEPNHGWGIGQRIQQLTGDVLEVNQGSLYPALQRLEYKGWIRGEWGSTEQGRRARFYRLTASGRRAAESTMEDWRRHVAAVEMLIMAT